MSGGRNAGKYGTVFVMQGLKEVFGDASGAYIFSVGACSEIKIFWWVEALGPARGRAMNHTRLQENYTDALYLKYLSVSGFSWLGFLLPSNLCVFVSWERCLPVSTWVTKIFCGAGDMGIASGIIIL